MHIRIPFRRNLAHSKMSPGAPLRHLTKDFKGPVKALEAFPQPLNDRFSKPYRQVRVRVRFENIHAFKGVVQFLFAFAHTFERPAHYLK